MTGLYCRASAEAPVMPGAPAAAAPQHAARRTTREKAFAAAATSAGNAALPPRQPLAPAQRGVNARAAQAAPAVVMQPSSSHSARQSLLSRHAPPDGIQQQQQQQPVATPSGGVMSQQPPRQRLTAIPEAAEAATAHQVPQGLQQDTAGASTAARQGSAALSSVTAPADAVSPAALLAAEEGAATRQHPTNAPRLGTPHLLAGPRETSSPHNQSRSVGGNPSSPERLPHPASHLVEPATAPTAVREGMTQAAAPLTLMQLATAPTAQQQQQLASPHGHSAAQAARHPHRPAAQQATPLPQATTAMPQTLPQASGAVEAAARQDAGSSGADILQSLQASLVQTVTAAVESAMTQVRWDCRKMCWPVLLPRMYVTCMTPPTQFPSVTQQHTYNIATLPNTGS